MTNFLLICLCQRDSPMRYFHLPMRSDSLTDLYQWAQGHLGQPIMLGYQLNKVNGQTSGSLFVLLRQIGAKRPDAEIQIEYMPDRELPYQASFSALPFTTRIPRPERLHVNFGSPPEVIQWLKTGHKRMPFSANSETDDLEINPSI